MGVQFRTYKFVLFCMSVHSYVCYSMTQMINHHMGTDQQTTIVWGKALKTMEGSLTNVECEKVLSRDAYEMSSCGFEHWAHPAASRLLA